MRRHFLNLLLCAALAVPAVHAAGNPDEYSNGAPRGEDGRFTNAAGEIGHGTFAVRFPFMLRRLGTYFRSGEEAPERVANDGVFLRENARHSVPTVTWIGHATLLVQMGHVTFLTDPTWSNRPSPVPLIGPGRFVEPQNWAQEKRFSRVRVRSAISSVRTGLVKHRWYCQQPMIICG